MRAHLVAALACSAALLVGCTPVAGEPAASATPSASASATPIPAPTSTIEPSENPSPTPSEDPGVPEDASPEIDYLSTAGGTLTIAVTIGGVQDADGVCRVRLSKGAERETVELDARYNVNRTVCGGDVIALDELSSGDWTLDVVYSSARHRGVSASQIVTIP